MLSPEPVVRDREATRLIQVVFLLGTGQCVTLNVEDGTWQHRQPAPVLAALSERLAWNADLPLQQLAAEITLTNHERWDGRGYPHGWAGTTTPLSGRIVAVADVFDALTRERPYKAAWSGVESAQKIQMQVGQHFDPAVVEAFRRVTAAQSAVLTGQW